MGEVAVMTGVVTVVAVVVILRKAPIKLVSIVFQWHPAWYTKWVSPFATTQIISTAISFSPLLKIRLCWCSCEEFGLQSENRIPWCYLGFQSSSCCAVWKYHPVSCDNSSALSPPLRRPAGTSVVHSAAKSHVRSLSWKYHDQRWFQLVAPVWQSVRQIMIGKNDQEKGEGETTKVNRES